jgi:hypothetical protein
VPDIFQRVSDVNDSLEFCILESAKRREIVVAPEAYGKGRRQQKR